VGKVISLANQKGGVGKTTTTINLGAALGELGQRVLLVDFDPQGALSVGVGVNSMELDATIYNLLLDRSVGFGEVVTKTNTAGVELLPGNIDLSAAEVVLVSEVAREQALKRVLAPVRDDYDFVLIDCPPSLGLLTINALTASDSVIIPLECEFFALRGMALLVDTIDKVRDRLNPTLEIDGVVPTMFDGRTLHAREVLERVREAFGARLYKTNIPRTIRFAEAPVAGEPITTYAGASNGAVAYRNLAKEVLGIDVDQTSEPAGSVGAVPLDDHAGSTGTSGNEASRDTSTDQSIDSATSRQIDEAPSAEAGEREATSRGEGDVLLHP
jgi:chromosome partitioning protein